MFVVVVYDIELDKKGGQRRLCRIMKLCRRFLHHTQKSVFEGEISVARLKELEMEINRIINEKKDYVVIYKVENKNNLERKNIGINFNPNEVII